MKQLFYSIFLLFYGVKISKAKRQFLDNFSLFSDFRKSCNKALYRLLDLSRFSFSGNVH